MNYKSELVEDLNLFKKLYMQEREKNEGYVLLVNDLENRLNSVIKNNIELTNDLKEYRKFRKMFFEQKRLVMSLSKKLDLN